MVRRIKKNIALEQRRQELDEELQAIRRQLNRRTRGEHKLPDPVAVLRRIWSGPELDEPGPLPSRSSAPAEPVPEPLSDERSVEPAVPSVGDPPGAGPIRRGDARFASYFVTGGLHGIEPQRHDRHILRNRMIAWVGLVLFILITIIVIYNTRNANPGL